MPTYDYVCEKCGHQFELVQSMTEKYLTVCLKAHCPQKRWGKGRVKRQMGLGAGLIFKGSGFYITDYRSEKYKEAAKNDKAPSPASTESKPAPAKTEAKTETKPSKPASAPAK